ncbi:MAG: tRNA pseudouridine(38-40) synthase TruA, partial [Lachnospiraceae bacterium]|nr:tRNA pseudouridine(38-40) synthase TruA [Lachnospiraceae bacterium]
MRNFKMLIRYDGSRYKGWQRLKDNDLTIQGKLQEILIKYAGTYVEIIGSGRTDAGVHAKGQIANFHLDTKASPEELLNYFNRYLPDDIAVIELKECAPGFHARFNAISKTYRYTIRTSNIPDV